MGGLQQTPFGGRGLIKVNFVRPSVSQSVCLFGYAFRSASTLKLDKVVGHGPPRFDVNFSKRPDQRSSRGQSALEMPYFLFSVVLAVRKRERMH